ncbi:MAG: hypothetical protein JST39_14410 [Bacteroidetes bacterium]|nr:hypothetical protein [Bacteroidota bacterium]
MLASNPMIQEMGGIDKLKNMTEEQRAALAKQMMEKVKQNPSAYMQQPRTVTPASREASLAARDQAALSQAIDLKQTAIIQHAQEMTNIVSRLQLQTNQYFESVDKKLSDEYGARVKALPILSFGEAGHGKDTYLTDMAYNVVLYALNTRRAIAEKEIWMREQESMKITIGEFKNFLNTYASSGQLLLEKGISNPAVAASMCDQLILRAEEAKAQTYTNAGRQRNYDERVLHLFE